VEYLEVSTVSSVLARRALAAVRGVDGREKNEVTITILGELAGVAADLALPDADRFRTLAGAAASGNVRDLERAALSILIGFA